ENSLSITVTYGENSNESEFSSKFTGDKYTYVVTLPEAYNPDRSYPLLIYFDENLKSAPKVRHIVSRLAAENKIKPQILVGIRHHGYNARKRRRDFIPAHLWDTQTHMYYSNDPNYGQAEKFYQFLKQEFIPHIEGNYKVKEAERTVVGHSLGGLFVVYSLLRQDRIFDNHIAISPSLWANYQNIFKFEEQFYEQSSNLEANLYMCSGSLEVANLVRYHVDLMEHRLNERKYKGLTYDKKTFPWESHNSVVEPALEEALPKFLQ
ncbi:MAG: alpha/beta hydrolase-fold protein, partial [Bacteroidota bacterium]